MKKFIKLNGNRIIEIRPEQFEGSIEIEVSEQLHDLDILANHIYNKGKLEKSQGLINKANLQEEYFEIAAWLRENDWKINKVFLGEWADTDSRWTEYKEQRAIKRARFDKIKEALGV